MARHGKVRRGLSWQARLGSAWSGKAGHVEAGKARHGNARHGALRRGVAECGNARLKEGAGPPVPSSLSNSAILGKTGFWELNDLQSLFHSVGINRHKENRSTSAIIGVRGKSVVSAESVLSIHFATDNTRSLRG